MPIFGIDITRRTGYYTEIEAETREEAYLAARDISDALDRDSFEDAGDPDEINVEMVPQDRQ
jgi:hypothetical protein